MLIRAAANLDTALTPAGDEVRVYWIGDSGPPVSVPQSVIRTNPLYPFALRDLGTPFRQFAWVRLHRFLSGCEIAFDLERVSDRALSNALSLRRQFNDPGSTRIRYRYGGAWARELHPDPRSTETRLETLMTWASIRTLGALREQELDPSRPAALSRDLLNGWRVRNGRTLPDATSILSELRDHRRVSVFCLSEDGTGDLPAYVGRRSPLAAIFGRDWAQKPGALPDQSYEAAAQSPYATARYEQSPQSDRVLAAIQTILFPEPIWIRYDRTIAPAAGPGLPVICATTILKGPASPIP
jgi:hypothetical protein